MNQSCLGELESPRIQARGELWIAGLRGRFSCQPQDENMALWRRFLSEPGPKPNGAGDSLYGVCLDCAGFDTFEYLCGVEVQPRASIPAHWSRIRIEPHTYAVFTHCGHVSHLRDTVNAIFEAWLPQSGYVVAETADHEPDFVERYTANFDPDTGFGGIEIWLPVCGPFQGHERSLNS